MPAAQTYSRTAAAELRKASQEKRHDIDVLRKQISDNDQQRQKELMAGSGDMDSNERVNLERSA